MLGLIFPLYLFFHETARLSLVSRGLLGAFLSWGHMTRVCYISLGATVLAIFLLCVSLGEKLLGYPAAITASPIQSNLGKSALP